MSPAGYSGTPLAQKLGVEEGSTLVLLNAPEALDLDLPPWVTVRTRASKVPTDMTEDVVREVFLPLGLVDNKVCAVDETWSGLRVVWRKERRAVLRPG